MVPEVVFRLTETSVNLRPLAVSQQSVLIGDAMPFQKMV